MPKSRRPHRNDLGSLFAASVVTVLGTGLCCMLFAVGTRDGSIWPILMIAAPAVVFLFMVGVRWQGSGSGSGLGFWHVLFRSRADRTRDLDYEPRRAESDRVSPEGQQRPITASEVREIQLLNGNTWVPARGRRSKDDEYLD